MTNFEICTKTYIYPLYISARIQTNRLTHNISCAPTCSGSEPCQTTTGQGQLDVDVTPSPPQLIPCAMANNTQSSQCGVSLLDLHTPFPSCYITKTKKTSYPISSPPSLSIYRIHLPNRRHHSGTDIVPSHLEYISRPLPGRQLPIKPASPRKAKKT